MNEVTSTRQLQECVCKLFACSENIKILTTFALGENRYLLYNQESGIKSDLQLKENEKRVS